VTRLFTILLLIALLPLRGWAVERMANDMAAGAMPADCPMVQMAQAAPADTGSMDDAGTTTPTERTCQSCQLCMALAAPEMPIVQAAGPAPLTVAVHRADRFASAYLSPVSKPPIF
jgi:hypothetical protein